MFLLINAYYLLFGSTLYRIGLMHIQSVPVARISSVSHLLNEISKKFKRLPHPIFNFLQLENIQALSKHLRQQFLFFK